MRITSERSPGEKAFLLGFAGAVVGIALFSCILLPGRSDLLEDVLLMSIPFVVAFIWCAFLHVLLPAAREGIAPAGYAFLFVLLAFLLGLGIDLGAVVLPLAASAGTFLAGYLGQVVARRWVPLEFPPSGRPREPLCPHCGYGLYHAQDHRCPECGESFLCAEFDMRLARWENGVLKPRSPQGTPESNQEGTKSS